MHRVTVTLRLLPEHQVEFFQTVRSLEQDMTGQKGFKRSAIHHDIDDRTAFSLVVEWETEDDLKQYLLAEKFKILLGALKVLSQEAEISCTGISEISPYILCGLLNSY
jgi:heme-degrading monooxygenase HmoA